MQIFQEQFHTGLFTVLGFLIKKDLFFYTCKAAFKELNFPIC